MKPGEKSASVSLSASETARPPTPNAVKSGVMERPKDCRIISVPIARMVMRNKFVNIAVDGNALPLPDAHRSSMPTEIFDIDIVTERISRVSAIFAPYETYVVYASLSVQDVSRPFNAMNTAIRKNQ